MIHSGQQSLASGSSQIGGASACSKRGALANSRISHPARLNQQYRTHNAGDSHVAHAASVIEGENEAGSLFMDKTAIKSPSTKAAAWSHKQHDGHRLGSKGGSKSGAKPAGRKTMPSGSMHGPDAEQHQSHLVFSVADLTVEEEPDAEAYISPE